MSWTSPVTGRLAEHLIVATAKGRRPATKEELAVLEVMWPGQKYTAWEIARLLPAIKKGSVWQRLDRMRQRGLIVRHGDKNWHYYTKP